MITAQFQDAVDADWLDVTAMRVGDMPSFLPTPHVYVTVANNGEPSLRVDVYVEHSYPFHEAGVWHDWIVIGICNHLHLVDLNGSARTFNLGSYFGHLYPTEDRLLVASGEDLFCITINGNVAWTAEVLGLDGVIVDRIEGDVVYGQGEWDPPGGWKPFQVDLTTGALISGLKGERVRQSLTEK